MSNVEEQLNAARNNVESLNKDLASFKITGEHHKEKCDEVLSTLPSIDDPKTKLKAKHKAIIYYVKGAVYDLSAKYVKEAEENLSKAVKFDPSAINAWNSLGHTLWKKADLLAAQDCYLNAIQIKQNKVSYRELSRILRLIDPRRQLQKKQSTDVSDKTEQERLRDQLFSNAAESIEMAKKAVSMDVSDGESWYLLGHSYINVFMSKTLSVSDIESALKAFQQAQNDESMTKNPDLYYNRAIVYKYLELYQSAHDDLKIAFELDPSLKKDGQPSPLEEIKQLFEKIQLQFTKYQNITAKQKANLMEKIPTDFWNTLNLMFNNKANFKNANLKDLSIGVNSGLVLSLKVISCVTPESNIPSVFVCIDKNGDECVVSVYNVQYKAIRGGDILSIPSPSFNNTTLQESGVTRQFQHIRIPNAQITLFVNQQPLQKDQLVTPSMSVQTFM
ncbi:tetratricopeptide-repeat protein [Acrasis kona]|uniref:Tetratricopeptide-repeat protein n=1 Tax=Acrasis kona TaxID=1008807 RepID=A0AAW2Z5M5_9EUKA